MLTIDIIHNSLMKSLPAINQQACEIFGIKHIDTEILKVEKQRSPFGYSPSKHKLLLCGESAPRTWVDLGVSFSKYLPQVSLDEISTVYLAHEVPHHINDAANGYEIGKEDIELHKLSMRENKYMTNCVAWIGISEGIADCAKTNILNNLDMKNLLAAEKARSEYFNKRDSSSISKFNMRQLLREIESLPSILVRDAGYVSQIISLTGHIFREELEKESLDNFRRFIKEQKASRITYDDAKKILKSTLNYAKTNVESRIYPEQRNINVKTFKHTS